MSEQFPDRTTLSVLHFLRCAGFTIPLRITQATGLTESTVESTLIDLGVAGFVTKTPGEFGGWGLTPAGTAEDARLIADELDRAGAREAVTATFAAFMVLNPEALDLCSAWQMRSVDGTMLPNDHSAADYDARVMGLFADFHERAATVCAELSAALPRFDHYHRRLTDALDRAKGGDIDYVTDNTNSYHTVWFQLHEDLLVTLGIPRTH
ncbi:hypothetical protein [Alloactinosynnema sp. L-07]|uniref:hypothetical protein n=1 Tax=Alloactinosynnema sp. L-07 TaxID=1653480 RepID=UPI00065EF4F5|nr:hypothetical protein [Alloactinosynnema sp. L-07]CRK58220.1 hypothetical protein [Alloactinosynnema sp. L-07]